MKYKCPQCENTFSDDKPNDDNPERPNCPHCGHKAGKLLEMKASISASATVRATANVIRLTQQLMVSARILRDENHSAEAIIVAQTACEVATERAIIEALNNRSVPELEEIFDKLLPSYNITNFNVRKLYSTLTGNDVTKEGFWSDIDISVKLRNKIIHKGVKATIQQATDAINAVDKYINHIGQY